MKLIEKIEELDRNLNKFDSYLIEGTNEERKDTIGLIQRGICFVAYEVDKEMRFAPSKFIGYQDNSLSKHLKDVSNRDGRKTNATIDKLLNESHEPNHKLEEEFLTYCSSLDVIPHNKERKFWEYNLPIDKETTMITDIAQNILNFNAELEAMTELWQPKIVAESDSHIFKLVKVQGEFTWHIHDTAKVLMVFDGSMKIDFREDTSIENDTVIISNTVSLSKGEIYLVPENTNHKPHADEECSILLIEMK